MTWWRFNMGVSDPKAKDYREFQCWTHVMPGDIVQSRSTLAWCAFDFSRRHEKETKILELKGAPVLVLSRHHGIPGETRGEGDNTVTFSCLSRHGIIMVLGMPDEDTYRSHEAQE